MSILLQKNSQVKQTHIKNYNIRCFCTCKIMFRLEGILYGTELNYVPELSVAPIIFSGSSPRSNPCTFLSSLTFLLPSSAFLFLLFLSFSLAALSASNAFIKLGQSRFSSGSHVLSSSPYL